MASDLNLLRELTSAVESSTLVKLVLARGVEAGVKTSVRPVVLKGETKLQWAERRGKQETDANLLLEDSKRRLKAEFPARFQQVNLLTTEADFEFRLTKKGDVVSRRGKPSSPRPPEVSHDAVKHYLIPEGRPCPFLEAVGVMTAEGRVHASMQHKFRQINRFLEFVNDVYRELPGEGILRVVDFGCGKSYLTLAIHHLLTVIHRREVDIVGIDRTAELVDTCRAVATRLELTDLQFQVADIGAAEVRGPVHLAVALHACDTATDAALATAVEWRTNVILAAPCCQHEVASKINSPALDLLLTHGILKERFAALATDALRAAGLEAMGYRTQVIEFIEMDHTPKNLLIRAVRRERPEPEVQSQWKSRFESLRQLLGVDRIAVGQFMEPA